MTPTTKQNRGRLGAVLGAALALGLSAAILGTAAVGVGAAGGRPQPPPKVIWCQVPGLGRIFTASTCQQFEEGDVQILALRPGTPYTWTLGPMGTASAWVSPRYKGKPLAVGAKAPFSTPMKAIWYGLPITTGWRFDTGVAPGFVRVLRYAQTRKQPFLFALLAEEMQMGVVTPKVATRLAFAPGAKAGFRYRYIDAWQSNSMPNVLWSLVSGRFLTYSIAIMSTNPVAPIPQAWKSSSSRVSVASTDRDGTWTMTLTAYQADAPMRVNPKGNVTKSAGRVWGTGAAVLSMSVKRIDGRWVVIRDESPIWGGY